MKRLVLVIFVGLLIGMGVTQWTKAAPQTWTANSCSYADVLTAVTSAVTGDTVQIPGGTCTWTTQLVFTGKSITIQGVGAGTETQCAVPGQTTYTCLNRNNSLINWTTVGLGNPAGLSVLKNLTIDTSSGTDLIGCSSAAGSGTYNVAAVNFAGTSDSVRVTGMRFVYGHGCGALRFGRAYGVVDHTDFVAHLQTTHAVLAVRTASLTSDSHGDESWSTASSMGGAKNVFIEDSTFTADATIIANTVGAYFTDHFLGGRAVVRFSTITGGSLQQHGTESGGRDRSARHVEYYRNKFVWTGALTPTFMAIRGATGKLWDNTATGSVVAIGQMNTDRAGADRAQAGYYPWAYCGIATATQVTQAGGTATVTVPTLTYQGGLISAAEGISNNSYLTISGANQSEYNGTFVVHNTGTSTFTYTVSGNPSSPATGTITVKSPFDGNTAASGYPCLDQTGRGTGTALTGEGPNDGNTLTPKAWPTQRLDPVLCWNNLVSTVLSACTVQQGGDVITSLVDYYNQHTSYNGTTNRGIGRGSRGSRPAACTKGDGWFATDDATNWNLSTTETYSANISGLTSGADGALDICDTTGNPTGHWTDTTNAICDEAHQVNGVSCYVSYTYPHPLNYGYVAPTPSNPTGVRVVGTTTATSGTLIWTPSTNSDFKSYKVYHGLASGSYTLPVTTITVASSLAAHKPLAQHTFQSPFAGTHYFVVTEVNTQDLESPVSSEVSVALTGLVRTKVGGEVLASDTFDGTGATLGANWSSNAATNVLQRVSDIATTTDGANDTAARYSAITWPNDQRSAVVYNNVLTTGGLGAGYGPCVRISTSGTTATYYRLVGSTAGWALGKMIANSFTTLASNATPAFEDAKDADLEAKGSTLTARYKGTVIATVTDTSLASGAAGICYSSTGGNSTTGITAWQGLSAGVARP